MKAEEKASDTASSRVDSGPSDAPAVLCAARLTKGVACHRVALFSVAEKSRTAAAFEVSAWQCMKIGAGPVPIETSEGWLLLYHGVLRSCNGYVYAFGSALLDLDQPWKTIARSGPYLISPREIYELTGDVPNVTFPCASLHDPETGRIAVYYGCADTVTGLAFGYIPEIIDFTKQNSIL